jgi:hypothetical protein
LVQGQSRRWDLYSILKEDNMKNKMSIIVLACVIVALLIAIVTTESTDFDLEFAVDKMNLQLKLKL